MAADLVIADHPGGVRLITLNRPAAGNAMNDELLTGLHATVSAAAVDQRVRAMVLTGAGTTFCVGADVDQLEASMHLPGGPVPYWRSRLDTLAALVTAITSAPVPVICAVNGQAAGAGFGLALSCDQRIASERAAFNVAYGALGSSTDAGLAWLLVRTVGYPVALRLLMEQPVIRAAQARELGLVSDVVPAGELMSRSLRLAAFWGSGSPHATRSAKQLASSAAAMSLDEHIRLEHEAFIAGLRTQEVRQALAGRSERRGTDNSYPSPSIAIEKRLSK